MQTLCAIHPDAVAIGRCVVCSRPYCPSCVVEDVVRELEFCSPACFESGLEIAAAGGRPVAELIADLRKPIRKGWRLASRSMGTLMLLVALPVGAVVGLLGAALALTVPGDPEVAPAIISLGTMAIFVSCLAPTAVVLARQCTGGPVASPWPLILRRGLSWGATWVLYGIVVFAGTMLFILPGIWLAARLFWADEFALVHGRGPIASLRESWEMTRGIGGRIWGFQMLVGWAGMIPGIPLFFVLVFLVEQGSRLPSGPLSVFVTSLAASVVVTSMYASAHAPEVVYFYGLRALRADADRAGQPITGDWVARALWRTEQQGAPRVCPSCGSGWNPADHRNDVAEIACTKCGHPLPRSRRA